MKRNAKLKRVAALVLTLMMVLTASPIGAEDEFVDLGRLSSFQTS